MWGPGDHKGLNPALRVGAPVKPITMKIDRFVKAANLMRLHFEGTEKWMSRLIVGIKRHLKFESLKYRF